MFKMNKTKEDFTLTKLLNALTARSLIIGVVCLLYILVYRLTVCYFYRIPVNISSMDIKNILPVVLIVLFLYTYPFLLFTIYGDRLSTEDNDEFSKIISMGYSSFISKNKFKKIRNRKTIINFLSFSSYVKSDLINSYSLILLMIVFAGVFSFGCGIYYQDSIIKSGNMYEPIVLEKTKLVFCFLYFIVFFILYIDLLKKAKEQCSDNNNQENAIEERRGNIEIQMVLLPKNILNAAIIILCVTFVEVFLGCSCFLYHKEGYKTIETSGDKYVIVSEDDNYHIAKPVRIEKNNLIIDLDKYIYIEKDKVLVNYIKYENVMRESHVKESSF